MPLTCISCSSFSKFWLKDGAHVKPICTTHKVLYEKKGYYTFPMAKRERKM